MSNRGPHPELVAGVTGDVSTAAVVMSWIGILLAMNVYASQLAGFFSMLSVLLGVWSKFIVFVAWKDSVKHGLHIAFRKQDGEAKILFFPVLPYRRQM